jgi:hypothetical protein
VVLEYDGAVEAAVSHGEWDEASSESDMVDLWLRWIFFTSIFFLSTSLQAYSFSFGFGEGQGRYCTGVESQRARELIVTAVSPRVVCITSCGRTIRFANAVVE